MFFKFQTSRKVAQNCIMNIHIPFTYIPQLPMVNTQLPLSQTATLQILLLADFMILWHFHLNTSASILCLLISSVFLALRRSFLHFLHRAFTASFPWNVCLLFSTCPNLIHTWRCNAKLLLSVKLALLNSPSVVCGSFYSTYSFPLGTTIIYMYVSHPPIVHKRLSMVSVSNRDL